MAEHSTGPAILAANLTRLRDRGDISQGDLAARAGISRVAYRNIETGKTKPRAGTLEAIARALGVPLAELLRPAAELRQVRFRSEGQERRSRQAVLARVANWLRDYAELEELLNQRVTSTRVNTQFKGTGDARARDAARVVRRRFGLASGELIRDICGLLEAQGIKVLALQLRAPGFFGLSVASGTGAPAIVVNTLSRITVERWIFTTAHELAHLMLHRDDYSVDEADENSSHEQEAHVFASHFLMPDDVFLREWRDAAGLPIVQRVLKLKGIFRVSWMTVLHRAREHDGAAVWGEFLRAYQRQHGKRLGRIDEPRALRPAAFSQSFAEDRPSHEPEGLAPGVFVQDRLHLLVRQAVEKQAITLSRAAEILDIDLHEMRTRAASWAR
jgi:Zn-dependent peptidase ImmA (M78 family)/DNA-binding XRE family transcriptional regulator